MITFGLCFVRVCLGLFLIAAAFLALTTAHLVELATSDVVTQASQTGAAITRALVEKARADNLELRLKTRECTKK